MVIGMFSILGSIKLFKQNIHCFHFNTLISKLESSINKPKRTRKTFIFFFSWLTNFYSLGKNFKNRTVPIFPAPGHSHLLRIEAGCVTPSCLTEKESLACFFVLPSE